MSKEVTGRQKKVTGRQKIGDRTSSAEQDNPTPSFQGCGRLSPFLWTGMSISESGQLRGFVQETPESVPSHRIPKKVNRQ